jgi:hypothetical protein
MVTRSHSFGYIPLLAKSGDCSPNESMLEWSQTTSCFYVTSRVDKGLISELQNHHWRVVSVGKQMLALKSQFFVFMLFWVGHLVLRFCSGYECGGASIIYRNNFPSKGWCLTVTDILLGPGNECSVEVPGVLNVGRLQELLLTLATLIKKVNRPCIYLLIFCNYKVHIIFKSTPFFDLGNRWLVCSGNWVCNETITRGGLCKGKFPKFVTEC